MKKLIVILAVIAMVGAFTATAMADVSLYGSVRFGTYYVDKSQEFSHTGYDDADLKFETDVLSRFGANFKSDKLTGKFELDARPGIGASSAAEWYGNSPASYGSTGGSSHLGNMRLRHLWGEYDFGWTKLMIGQNFPLYDAPVSGVNFFAGGLQEFGGIGYLLARTGQIRLTFGNLRLAFMSTDTRQAGPVDGVNDYTADKDTTLPKVELRYDMKMDNFAMNFIGGYQTYDVVNATDSSESINSFVLGGRAIGNFGPLYAKLSLTWRQNGNNYGAWTHVGGMETATIEGTDIKDATAWGGVAAVGFKINDMISVEGSYGMVNAERDTTLTNEDDAAAFAIVAPIKLSPAVMIVPEFIYVDEKDITVDSGQAQDQGNVTIFGVWWKIDFK